MSNVLNTTSTRDAWNKPFLRIGHGGASGHARANSLRSLSLALEMGVDVVEFDVRPCRDALVLLHDDSVAQFGGGAQLANASTLQELRGLATADGPIPTMAEALDLLKGRALINVDVKAAGYEDAVLEMVRAKGLAGDVIYSTVITSSLLRIRKLDPHAMTGLSYPEDKGNASANPYLKPVVNTVVAGMRLTLAYRILSMMTSAQANAVMLYHKVVSAPTIRTVQRSGGKVFTWTVDELAPMRRLHALGVNGITTNHPELFAQLA